MLCCEAWKQQRLRDVSQICFFAICLWNLIKGEKVIYGRKNQIIEVMSSNICAWLLYALIFEWYRIGSFVDYGAIKGINMFTHFNFMAFINTCNCTLCVRQRHICACSNTITICISLFGEDQKHTFQKHVVGPQQKTDYRMFVFCLWTAQMCL